jgi:hypothetical protein
MQMMRTRAVWMLTLPMLVLGETVGHAFFARLFDPHGERHMLLARAARDYLEYVQAAGAICLALAATGLARRAVAAFRGRAAGSFPSWRLAAVPSLAFLAQEHLERFFHNGEIGWLTVGEPAVMLGAVVQLPCGLLALWLVRTLLRAADELGHALSRRAERRVSQRPALEICHGRQDDPLRLLALARGLAERAPPSFA